MAKNEFKFDPISLEYKKAKMSKKERFFKVFLTQFIAGVVIAVILFVGFSYVTESPSERKLKRENSQLNKQYKKQLSRLEQTEKVLKDVQSRDDNIHRAIFETDPTKNSKNNEIKNRYELFLGKGLTQIVSENYDRLIVLRKKMRTQSITYNELAKLVNTKESMLNNIPSIQPVANKKLKLIIYGYGQRIDPIYKTPAFHPGIDFAVPERTPVYATADGTVIVANEKRGHGKQIRISHSFGYKTIYSHLSKIMVHRGKKIKRGQIIGLVGNTGKSITPHLHYEISLDGKTVNPINFFFADLSPTQYNQLIEISSRGGLSLD